MKLPYKTYGLEGRTVTIKPKVLMDESSLLSSSVVEPWRYAEQKAVVVQETPYFLTVEIQKHRAPHSWGDSTPYKTAIHKHDIYAGNIIMKTLDGERVG